jgi:predicted O-methyltransferase YrrM
MDVATMKQLRKDVQQTISRQFKITEGGTSPEEMHFLRKLADKIGADLVAEIGMNTGYSTHAFLAGCQRKVISFDLGGHDYVPLAKAIIDGWYPMRHDLVPGNSLITVPAFAKTVGLQFPMIFIDGGHSYKCAMGDLQNMAKLALPKACVVMDDTTPHRGYGRMPYKAWNDAELDGLIVHQYFVQDGVQVEQPTPAGTHVWAVGYYNDERITEE